MPGTGVRRVGTAPYIPRMSPVASPLAVVQQVYAALGRKDVPALLTFAASDSVWTVHAPKEHPYGGTYRGQGGLGMFLKNLSENAQLLEYSPLEFHVAGDQVFVVGRERVRWKPSGGEFTGTWLQRWRVRDGKIAVFEEWLDTATALAARAPSRAE